MIYPSVDELTCGKCNRYTLVIAASKCARMVTDQYVKQRETAERRIANKETDKSLTALINNDLCDDKAVKIAIKRLYDGEYIINEGTLPRYCTE